MNRIVKKYLSPTTSPKLRQYLIFTLAVGTVLGFLSMVSDTLPYQDVTLYDTAVRFIAELMNDTITWLGLSIAVGCFFSRSKTQALLMGAGFALFSMIIFLLLGLFDPEEVPGNVQSFAFAYIIQWLCLSIAGGALGGLIGFITKTHPGVLSLFTIFIVVRLIEREHTWQNIAGAMGNIVFITIALGSIAWIISKACFKRDAQT